TDNVGLLRNCPVNINAGTNVLYVTMADGKAFKVDRKGKITDIKRGTSHRFASVCEWKNGVAGVTKDGRLLYLEEGKDWITVGETEVDGKKKNDVRVQSPTDLMTKSGDLYIVDSDHHLVRMIGSVGDKLMKNFWFRPSQELIGFDVANTGGDLVQLDTLFLANQPVEFKLILDLEGYQIVSQGQNEVFPVDPTGKIKIGSETIRKEEITVKVDPDFPDPDIYIEMYLTLEHPENKGLFLIKRVYLVTPVMKVESAETTQEQIYKPTLLPY
ncbi:MAG: hypothetical protein ACKOZM_07680, partial [Flavobacteriales bacterium]